MIKNKKKQVSMARTTDLAEFYRLQNIAIQKEKSSESHGITKTEKAKLRGVLGYVDQKKPITSAGAYTREALGLDEPETKKAEESGHNDATPIGQVPGIFTEVS